MPRQPLWKTLSDYRRLAAWAVGGSLPFVAALKDLAPPWPPGLIPLTSIAELVALLLAHIWLWDAPTKKLKTVLMRTVAGLVLAAALYLAAFSVLTYTAPTTNERFIRGFKCTEDAELIFKTDCPLLTDAEIRTGRYEASTFWTEISIWEARMVLVALWLGMFAGLSVLICGCLSATSRLQSPPATRQKT